MVNAMNGEASMTKTISQAAWAMVRGGAPTPHVSLTSVSTRAGNAHRALGLLHGVLKGVI